MTFSEKPALVFLVDDDLGILRLLERALQRTGFQIASAGSGQEAIDWLRQHRPDLILLDLKLPDMEGGELIRELASIQSDVPFIIITGQGDERVAVEMMKRGALDYLVKDVSFVENVPGVVRRALAQISQEKRTAAAEAAVRESQALTQAVLNSLSANVAVLDQSGTVVAMNEPWLRFVGEDCAPTFLSTEVGTSFVELCRRAVEKGEEGAERVGAMVQAVLEGSSARASIEGRYFAPQGERWCLLTVTPLLGMAGGAVVTHVDITERKRMEAEALRIAENERQRVAADLHDGICQELAGIAFSATALQREARAAGGPLLANLKVIEESLANAVRHTREVARGLVPVVADGLGLANALEQLASTAAEMRRIECVFNCPDRVVLEDSIAANELYRIAQEALTNALRHSRATRIELRLFEDGNGVCLVVSDNGTGLPARRSDHLGMGLRLMHYGAGVVRGRLEIRTGVGGGTEVVCWVPKVRDAGRAGLQTVPTEG